MKHPKRTCSLCKKERLIRADLVIHVYVALPEEQVTLNLKHPLCGHCFRKVGGKGSAPMVHLSSGGVVKRTTVKQEEAKERASKHAERRRLQQELTWE